MPVVRTASLETASVDTPRPSAQRAPFAAWLVVAASAAALASMAMPWFRPIATLRADGQSETKAVHGTAGFLTVPTYICVGVIFVVLAGLYALFAVALPGRGPRFVRRLAHPRRLGTTAICYGVFGLIAAGYEWSAVLSQYRFPNQFGDRVTADEFISLAHDQGVAASFTAGPLTGMYVLIAACVAAIIGGVLVIVTDR